MFNIKLSRRNLFAIFLGFLLIVAVGILTQIIHFFMVLNIMRITPPNEFKNAFSQQPVVTINWLLGLVSFVSPILGGFVVGYMTREKGWLYGGLLGITMRIITIIIASLPFILPTSILYGPQSPPNYVHGLAWESLLNQLLYSPLIIFLTSLGGFLGERFYRRRVK